MIDRVTRRLWRGVEGPRGCLINACSAGLSGHQNYEKIESTQPPSAAKRRDRQFSLVGRQISGLLTSLAPWTGAPGSHQRTWEEKDGGEAPTKAFISRSRFSYPWSESMRKKPFSTQVRWCEPGAPVQGARLGGKPGKRRRKDSQPPNRAKVISLFTRHRRVDCS